MTLTLRAAAAAAAVLLLALTGGAADARGNHWTTVVKVHRGKVQACKVPTSQGGPWKVRLRVDATHATATVKGSAQVQKDGEAVGRRWRSGRVDPGSVSEVDSLRLPRGSAYQFEAQIESEGAGSGVLTSAGAIHRC